MTLSLIIPAFIAGILTFLAPCTLPLVPGYLSFISGVSINNLKSAKGKGAPRVKILLNGFLYVLGFSIVFIILGGLFGLGGSVFSKYRLLLARIGGIFVIFFGLYMVNVLKLPLFNFLAKEKKLAPALLLTPGKPASSFIFGTTFAFGWSPCVGPILASILFLASTSETLLQGALLLTVFSVGLAIPFLLTALFLETAFSLLGKIGQYLKLISIIGGVFLIFLGFLMLTNNFNNWLAFSYRLFSFINYEKLLDYL